MVLVTALLPLAIGFLLVRRLWPCSALLDTLALRWCLAWGAGAGIASLLYFAGLLLLGEANTGWVLGSEAAVLVVFAAANLGHRVQGPPLAGNDAADAPRAVVWLAAVAALAAAVSFVLATLRDPLGVADALSIWNLRAHLLFGSGTEWRRVFLQEVPELSITHPDYPLLLPGLVVRTWQALGAAAPAVPGVVAFGFTAAIAGLLCASLGRLRGATAGWLAAGVLLGCPAFVAAGAAQLADLPLAFFVLATFVSLALHDEGSERGERGRGLLVLAGLALGLAAWTKNEGMLFAVVLPVARAVARRRRPARELLGEGKALLLGASPSLAALLVFKLWLVPPNDLVAQVLEGHAAGRVFDAARWLEIARGLAAAVWSLGPTLLGATLLWAVLCRRERFRFPLAVAVLVLAGYLATYLVASHNLSWHLASSLDRLLLHLLPAALFGVFSGRPRAAAS